MSGDRLFSLNALNLKLDSLVLLNLHESDLIFNFDSSSTSCIWSIFSECLDFFSAKLSNLLDDLLFLFNTNISLVSLDLKFFLESFA